MNKLGRTCCLFAIMAAVAATCLGSTAWAASAGEPAAATPGAAAAGESVPAEAAREALAEQEPKRPPVPAQVERGGLLLAPGRHEVELRYSLANFSGNTIFIDGIAILPVIVVGHIALERTRTDIMIGSWCYRLGLPRNTQFELMVPYRYQHNRNAVPEATPPREMVEDDQGLGDITAAVYRQLSGRHWGNTLVAGLQIKSRTGRDIFDTTRLVTVDDDTDVVQTGLPMGTGFWSAKAVLTGVRISDPAALFWNLGYTHSLPREHVTVFRNDPTTDTEVGETVEVSPGATFEYGFGMGYALNPELSINLQFQQSFTQLTRVRGTAASGWVAGSTVNAAILRLGAVWSTNPRSATEVSVSNGLTADSPDFVVELRKVYGY